MNAGLVELRCGEAGKKMEVLRLLGREDLREEAHDLRQAFAVPQGVGAIHGRSHNVPKSRILSADTIEDFTQLTKNGLDTLRHENGTFGISDEIRNAGDDADI